MRQLAPNAALRYKLLPRNADTRMDGIEVKIVGDTVTIPVAVAADHTFSLERNEKALDEYASVTLNRKEGSMTWRVDRFGIVVRWLCRAVWRSNDHHFSIESECSRRRQE